MATTLVYQGGPLGTPSSGDLSNCTGGGSSPIQSATVTLTAADVATLNSVPVILVAAPAQNYFIVPMNVTMTMTGGQFEIGASTLSLFLDTNNALELLRKGGVAITVPAVNILGNTSTNLPPRIGWIVPAGFAGAGTNGWATGSASKGLPLLLQSSDDFSDTADWGGVLTTSLASGGLGFIVGDILYDSGTDQFSISVDSVDVNGAVVTYTQLQQGPETWNVGTTISPGLLDVTFPITAVDQGLQTFTIAGNHVARLPSTALFWVTGSTGNDGDYTVASSVFGSGNTTVTVIEAIPDSTADGIIDLNQKNSPSLTINSIENNTKLTVTTLYRVQQYNP